jgi:hypothetical protein
MPERKGGQVGSPIVGELQALEVDRNPAGFYHQLDDDVFESTPATESPWDRQLQHGGPPSALLTRALEQVDPNPELALARISFDFLGGIPQGRLTTSATVLRPGRRIELVEATLTAQERVVVVARGWRIKPSDGSFEPTPVAPVPALPEAQPAVYFDPTDPGWGYGQAIEWRFVRGSFAENGPAMVWARVKIPLVVGEHPTGLQRMVVLADSTNGLGSALDLQGWLFVPPGLTLHTHRIDAGDWLLLDASTVLDASGMALARSTISDIRGPLGLIEQPLLVQRRAEP